MSWNNRRLWSENEMYELEVEIMVTIKLLTITRYQDGSKCL